MSFTLHKELLSELSEWYGTTETFAKDICRAGIKINNNFKPADFGQGFYTTPDFESSKRWAKRKAISFNDKPSVVSIVVDKFTMDSIITKFEDDLRWGRFVINNRNGMLYISKVDFKEHNLDSKYDITYGRIADLDVYNISKQLNDTCELLDDLNLILNKGYPFQYAFHTQRGIDCIKRTSYENV